MIMIMFFIPQTGFYRGVAAAVASGGVHPAVTGAELQNGARCYPSDLGGSRGHWHCQAWPSEEDPAGH